MKQRAISGSTITATLLGTAICVVLFVIDVVERLWCIASGRPYPDQLDGNEQST